MDREGREGGREPRMNDVPPLPCPPSLHPYPKLLSDGGMLKVGQVVSVVRKNLRS